MIYEIAELLIDPSRADAFESAVAGCAPLFQAARGCRSLRLERQIEDDARYRLVVGWETVEDHVDGFRNSPAFAAWRAAAGPFFLAPPTVVHTQVIATHF